MATLCLLEVTKLAQKRSTADERYFQKKIKKNKKWKTSHFILSLRRARDFHQIFHGDRGGPGHYFRSYTFLGPIRSFAARGRRKFGWKCPHRSKLLIILSLIEIKQPYLATLYRLSTRIKLGKFCKNRARDLPLRGNYIDKIPIFSVLGAVNPHPWTDQGGIWHEGADLHAKFHLDRCNVSPLRGEKPQNRPVSKNNDTGRAACGRSCL